MDEHRLRRRRPDARSAVEVAGLLLLALATLALVRVAAAGVAADPLASVTSSRVIPELVVGAVVVTVLVGLTLWVLMPVSPASSERARTARSGTWLSRSLAAVGWVVLVVLLVAVVQRLTDDVDDPTVEPEPEVAEESDDADSPTRHASGSDAVELMITVGGLLVGVVLVTWAVTALARRPIPPAAEDAELPIPAPPSHARSADGAVHDALRSVQQVLDHGDDPRLAVIAAYWQLEQALADAGVVAQPADTAHELLARALATLGPAAAPARQLTDLFDWAMFSQHAITESMRDDARHALAQVLDGLELDTRPAPERPGVEP